MTQETKYPEKSFRIGSVSSAIWRSQIQKDGRDVDRFSIKLQRRYQDPTTGEWKGSEIYLFPNEVPALITVANKAYEHCLLQEKEEDPQEQT